MIKTVSRLNTASEQNKKTPEQSYHRNDPLHFFFTKSTDLGIKLDFVLTFHIFWNTKPPSRWEQFKMFRKDMSLITRNTCCLSHHTTFIQLAFKCYDKHLSVFTMGTFDSWDPCFFFKWLVINLKQQPIAIALHFGFRSLANRISLIDR
jgi:hypothetical protein